MRSSKIIELLNNIISEEDRIKLHEDNEKYLKFQEDLFNQGYRYNTDKSYSLELLRKAGFYPIGITTMMCEETFIFKTAQDANKAWESRVLGYDGWWYGEEDFLKYVKEYEKDFGEIKVYWLDNR